MFKVFYTVRVVKDGKLIEKKRFLAKDKAFNWAKDNLIGRRQVRVRTQRVFVLETFDNSAWDPAPHDPWETAPKPVSDLFIHHSVTKQLAVTAKVDEERDQMKLLDQIAHSRGFNGISYCWVVFPSGRAWEGRGFGIVEAATEGHNTTSDSIVLAGNYSLFPLGELAKAAVIALTNRAQANGFLTKTGLDVHAHREVSQTSCPGDKISSDDIAAIQKAVN